MNCEALRECIMQWARHPKVEIDRATFFGYREPFDMETVPEDVILVVPWVIKELNMVGVPKDEDYLKR
jgi:hypothetical protein